MSRTWIVLSTAVLCTVFTTHEVRAANIEFSDAIDLMTTNWTQDVTFPKFDPALGDLNAVTLELQAFVKGLARFESLDPLPTSVTMNFFATVRLRRPDLTDLLVASPGTSRTTMVSAFDNEIDFDGTSGRTYNDLGGSAMSAMTLLAPFAPDDAALFVGSMEIVTLNVRAVGASNGNGPGNLILLFNTEAAANVRVIYEYTPIPEPASLILVIGALLLPRRFFRRRQSC